MNDQSDYYNNPDMFLKADYPNNNMKSSSHKSSSDNAEDSAYYG